MNPSKLPGLCSLFSYAFVGFTIELDNEAELRIQHWTTRSGGRVEGTWLCSAAMYWNCMRYVDAEGITLGELKRLARTDTNLQGMVRWRYVTIEPKCEKADRERMIRATVSGLQAREVWTPLFGEVEERWAARFGQPLVAEIRERLTYLGSRFEYDLPDSMPILHYGFQTVLAGLEKKHGSSRCARSLDTLFKWPLIALALRFEHNFPISLPLYANALRLVPPQGIPVSELPKAAGVSKEGIAMATGFIERHGYGQVVTDPGGRLKIVTLTAKGKEVKEDARSRLAKIEGGWRERFGEDTIDGLKTALYRITGDGAAATSPLFEGLKPNPTNWRANIRPPFCLPNYPLVLHRGGYPDGS
jgi:DNA-binding MarR family transcriptional regulator